VSWTPLASRLAQLPLVLAGPILRQVTPQAVTVWVALQRAADVTLKVFESGNEGTILLHATRKAVAIGKNLHIVAVIARSTAALCLHVLRLCTFSRSHPSIQARIIKGT
jgi:hypothetical protein